MGYRFNRLDEPVFMAGPKPMQTEFGIHHGLESCAMGFFGINVIVSATTTHIQGSIRLMVCKTLSKGENAPFRGGFMVRNVNKGKVSSD